MARDQFDDASQGQASLELEEVKPVRRLWRLRSDRPERALPQTVRTERLPLERRALGAIEFSWAGETLRHIGTVVHAALERMASLPELPQIDEAAVQQQSHREALRRLGVPAEELETASETVVTALRQTLSDERGRWILEPSHREAQNEMTLTGIADGRLISISIDRCFVDAAGTRWVIDYKTSRHKGADLDAFLSSELERYRSQLEGYVALAGALGPEPVRAALYFPLLGVLRELPASV